MKKVKIQFYLFLQAFLTLILPLFYSFSFSVKRNDQSVMASVRFQPLLLLLLVLIALFVVFLLRRRRENLDEYAKRALQIADSICFKISVLFIAAVLLPALFLATVLRVSSPIMVSTIIQYGKIIVYGIFVLFLIRALLFCWIDKKGLVD